MKPALEGPVYERTTTSLVAFVRRERTFAWNWHYHPEWELTWIRRGHGRRLVGDHTAAYRADDLVLLAGNLPHTWVSAPSSRVNEAVVVQFQPFPADLLRLPEFVSVSRLLEGAATGLSFSVSASLAKNLLRLVGRRGLPGWLGLMEILRQLSEGPDPLALASLGYRHGRSQRVVSRMEKVTAHVEQHFRGDLSLAGAARIAGLTASAFSRAFRKTTGQTFVGYRNACRIREACRLLIETDLSVTRIAGECGFENLANFNRRFRDRQGLSPREYRRLHNRPVR